MAIDGLRTKNKPFYGEKRVKTRVLNSLLFLCCLKQEEVTVGKLERDFQAKLIKELEGRFDGCIVMKLDSSYVQGIPDLLVLHGDRWATLECKKNNRASKRPNQSYYVDRMNEMSFSRFICPENKEEVLDDLQRAFET